MDGMRNRCGMANVLRLNSVKFRIGRLPIFSSYNSQKISVTSDATQAP